MKHRSKMTQRELNQLTDKSLNAYVIYEDGSRYYVRPQNNRHFKKSELSLIVGDDIKISVGEKNMLVLEDYNQKIKNKIVIRKDQII